jgi:hypothetical protein
MSFQVQTTNLPTKSRQIPCLEQHQLIFPSNSTFSFPSSIICKSVGLVAGKSGTRQFDTLLKTDQSRLTRSDRNNLSLNAVDTASAGLDTLLVGAAAGSDHPDAELADGRNVVLARVGSVAASTGLEDGTLDLSVGGGSRSRNGNAGKSGKDDGGELHVD